MYSHARFRLVFPSPGATASRSAEVSAQSYLPTAYDEFVAVSALPISEADLLADLAALGCAVRSVWELSAHGVADPRAYDVLLRHLEADHAPRIKEGIARALAIRALRGRAGAPLLRVLLAQPPTDSARLELRLALACALERTADIGQLGGVECLIADPAQHQLRAILRRTRRRLLGLAPYRRPSDPSARVAPVRLFPS
jgi:hypothetical protein